MAGQRRLDNFAVLVAAAIKDHVPGHVIEVGVWRGGASFLAAKTLELLGESAAGRRVYLADSYKGIPDQRSYLTPGVGNKSETARAVQQYVASRARGTLEKQDVSAHQLQNLNENSPRRVAEDARRVGLDMERLRFIVGYFNESLPALLEAEPQLRFAVIRLDGDTFASTYEAISALYPRLEPGGFLIVDDYTDWPSCRAAVEQYRTLHSISEPVTLVPHGTKEEVRGVYWRKLPSRGMSLCPGMEEDELRPSGAISGRTMLRLDAQAIDLARGSSQMITDVSLAKCVRPANSAHATSDITSSRSNVAMEGKTSTLLDIWKSYNEPHGLDRWDVYAEAYAAHLPRPHADLQIDMLEIGVQSGGSVRAWRQYYGRSLKYVGIDIDPASKRSEVAAEGTYIQIGSQMDAAFLRHVCEQFGPFDVIIDDGAHTTHSMWTSLLQLWPNNTCMKASSVYVIEDTCTMMSSKFVSNAGELAGIASEAWWALHHHWISSSELRSVLGGGFLGFPRLANGTSVAHNAMSAHLTTPSNKQVWNHPIFSTHLAQVHLYDSIAFLVRAPSTPAPTRIVRGTDWTRSRPVEGRAPNPKFQARAGQQHINQRPKASDERSTRKL